MVKKGRPKLPRYRYGATLATNVTLWENPNFHISINIYETIKNS